MRRSGFIAPLLLFLAIAACCFGQQYPVSVGSCGVSASGLEGCDWMSGGNIKPVSELPKRPLQLFTTTYVLTPVVIELRPSDELRSSGKSK